MAGGGRDQGRQPGAEALGKFKADTLPVGSLAMYRAKAQMIFDRAGYR
jgi:iron(III) transport system substrate-binding protein